MDDECEHGMGDPAWCVLCNGRARREAKQAALEAEMRVIPFWLNTKPDPKREARRVREWTSGNAIDARLSERGGMIDDALPVRSSQQRPTAQRRVTRLIG
jgi:hypothetical protein